MNAEVADALVVLERLLSESDSDKKVTAAGTVVAWLPQITRVVRGAEDQHDEQCGCEGEACDLGSALAELSFLLSQSAVRRHARWAKGQDGLSW